MFSFLFYKDINLKIGCFYCLNTFACQGLTYKSNNGQMTNDMCISECISDNYLYSATYGYFKI